MSDPMIDYSPSRKAFILCAALLGHSTPSIEEWPKRRKGRCSWTREDGLRGREGCDLRGRRNRLTDGEMEFCARYVLSMRK